jgi:hypothetical protein
MAKSLSGVSQATTQLVGALVRTPPTPKRPDGRMAKGAKRRKRFPRDAEIIAIVAENVRRIRKGKKPKVSQEALAFAADLDRTYVSGRRARREKPDRLGAGPYR